MLLRFSSPNIIKHMLLTQVKWQKTDDNYSWERSCKLNCTNTKTTSMWTSCCDEDKCNNFGDYKADGKHWRIQGAPPARAPLNRIQFFHFCICFCRKVPTSEVGAPPQRLGAPPPPPPQREILDPPLVMEVKIKTRTVTDVSSLLENDVL